MKHIENIELVYLKNDDYNDLLIAMKEAYSEIPNLVWEKTN